LRSFDAVPSGVRIASFLASVLDSLRLEPGILRLVIADSALVMMPLATTSGRAFCALVCGAKFPDHQSVIIAEVQRADDEAPIAWATVEIEWLEWVLQKRALSTDQTRHIATTDSAGRYKLCGAPAGSTLRSVTWHGADASVVVEMIVPPTGYVIQDFAMGSVEYIAVCSPTL